MLRRPLYGADRFTQGGLTFTDFQSTHFLHCGDRRPGRKRPTPAWALSDTMTREVLLAYMEARLCIRDNSGTLFDRLDRARAKALAVLPAKRALLETRIARYRKIARPPKNNGAQLRWAEREIANLDTEVHILPKLPEVANATIYLYHRLNFNSPTVAESLGIAAAHVRQLLFRMDRVAHQLWPETGRASVRPPMADKSSFEEQ